MVNYGFEVLLARYQQPGYYNDPDFLIVDWPWLTLDEKKSHFALWSSFSAPLIISSYIPDLTADELAYLTNKDIIAINQDPLALQATLVSQDGYFDVLTKSLSNGDRLLTVLNRGDETNSTTVSTERMGLEEGCAYAVKDLWTGKASKITGSIDITLASHATAIYRISGVRSVTPTGMIFNTASLKCMTADGSSIALSDCVGSNAQVWQVSSNGAISSLSSPGSCLKAVGGVVKLGHCNSYGTNSEWVYHVTGNVINAATGECLQDNGHHIGECGEERDRQVFGLPSGVNVVRGNTI
jgi:alpha-galactosidase